MATYLLLRNNRESGPLTKEQLIALGLKPYDLIWVDGRSAAWRYANEIPELKDHSPAVEEQPYDRFYKKNTPDPVKEYVEEMVKKHEEPVKKYVEPVSEPEEEIAEEYVNTLKRENPAVEVPQPINEVGQEDLEVLLKKYGKTETEKPDQHKGYAGHEANISSDQLQEEHAEESLNEVLGKQLNRGNGSVSVIMPKQADPVKKEEPVYKKVTVVEKHEPPVVKKTPVPIPVAELDDVNVQTKYSTPLDEIKERYVKQLSERKNASAQRKFISQTLKRAAIFVVVIGAGVLIGFAIKPGQKSNKQVAESNLANVPLVSNTEPAKDETVQATNNAPNTQEETKPLLDEVIEQAKTQQKEEAQQKIKPSEEKKILENPSSNPSAIESTSGERSKNIRSTNDPVEPVEKRSAVIGDLSDQVSVKANDDYKERDLGGFRNLKLTVSNDSRATLESVTVEVTYKKYNDDIASIKNIPFHAINPGESLTIKVPDNNRGAKLSYRIIRIDPRNP